MGLYGRVIVPRLIGWAMQASVLRPLRQRAVGAAQGRVIEIGLGSGLNLPFYGRDVTGLTGVDTQGALLETARRSAGWVPFPVSLLEQTAEHLPFARGSFDTAVVTWSLCSIGDPLAALRELHRVLVPGGRLLFVEHGLAEKPGTARWQRRLTPAWSRVSGGCHLDRRIDRLVERAGFTLEELERGRLVPGPELLTHHFLGVGRR